jgi:hypothetical protein
MGKYIHRYGWYNTNLLIWQVGDKEELNFIRREGTICIEVTDKWCSTKAATRKFEAEVLKRKCFAYI